MLSVTIPEAEYFDSEKNEFIVIQEQHLRLEHSLVSVSKWEAKWQIPFLSKKPKTREQSVDYIRLMTITQNVNPLVYEYIPDSIMAEVQAYIENPMSATVIKTQPKPGGQKVITSEVIYYWMTAFNIPHEYEKWHFNRLMTLIEICNIENTPKKKMSRNAVYQRNNALNEARRAQAHSKG